MIGSTVRQVAIVGRDARADALFDLVQPAHVYPRPQVRVVGWWPGAEVLPAGAARLATESLADLLRTPGLDLVVLAGAAAQDPDVVRAVIASRIEAVAFAPVAGDPDDVAALRVTTELRASLTGAQGFEALARGDVGEVLAAYVGVRVPADAAGAGDVLRRWLATALDLAVAATGSLPVRTYARSGRMFGGNRDHLQLLLRFADDAIATVDLLELPAGSAVAEVDVEITGREGLLRLKPLAHQVVATSFAVPGATERRAWHPEAIRVLIDDLLSVPAAVSRVAPRGSAALARWTTALVERLENGDEMVFES